MALEVVLIVLERLERRCALAAGEGRIEGVEAAEMVDGPDDRQGQYVRLITLELRLLVELEDVVCDLVGVAELCTLDFGELRELALRRRRFLRSILVADILPPLSLHTYAQT